MKWSVVLEAEGDRTLTLEEVVEFADAVAPLNGIASGIGSTSYSAKLVVHAADRAAAVQLATVEFARAAARAGLPECPIAEIDAISELEDDEVGYGE